MSSDDLAGRTALVTGAGALDGIGCAIARGLGRAGARVLLGDLPSSAVSAVAEMLVAEGIDAEAHLLDIAREEEVRALFAYAATRFGGVDVLVNNAANQGHAEDALVADMDVALWDAVFAVNARGTMLMCKHVLPGMIARGGGAIVNISSGTAQAGDMFATAYAATKGAINTLTKYVATQYGAQGIRCNAVAPGLVLTGKLQATLPPPMLEVFRSHSLVNEIARSEDIAAAVVFLAGDGARMMTGQIVAVDGGFYAHIPTVPEISRMMGLPGSAVA